MPSSCLHSHSCSLPSIMFAQIGCGAYSTLHWLPKQLCSKVSFGLDFMSKGLRDSRMGCPPIAPNATYQRGAGTRTYKFRLRSQFGNIGSSARCCFVNCLGQLTIVVHPAGSSDHLLDTRTCCSIQRPVLHGQPRDPPQVLPHFCSLRQPHCSFRRD